MKRSMQYSFATGPASPKAQLIGLSLVAVVTALIALWTGVSAYHLEQNGARAAGTIVALEGGDSIYAVYRFTDVRGREHTVRANVSSGSYTVGDRVAIVYPPDTPLHANIDSVWSLYFWPLLTGILSVAFLTGAGLVAKFRGGFQAAYIQQRGKLVTVRQNSDGSTTRSTRSSSSLLKWTTRTLCTISVLCYCASGWAAWRSYELTQDGVETRATVVKLMPTGSSHLPIFEFVDTAGKTQVVKSRLTTNDYLVGDELPVVYIPGDPQAARIYEASSLLSTPAFLAAFGTFCLLISFLVRRSP